MNMTKKKTEVVPEIPELNIQDAGVRASILKLAEILDGHSLFDPKELAEVSGISPDYFAAFTRVHKSSRTDPKYMIFDTKTGARLKELHAVYGLDVLRNLVHQLHGSTQEGDSKFGRGTMARCFQHEIQQRLKDLDQNSKK